MNLLQRLEALEAVKAAACSRAPKNDKDFARLTFAYLRGLRDRHPELVPRNDAGYWPCADGNGADIPVDNLAALAAVDCLAALVLAAVRRRDAHDLM